MKELLQRKIDPARLIAHVVVIVITIAVTLGVSLAAQGKLHLFSSKAAVVKVKIFSARIDPERRFAEVVFSRPVAAGHEGEILPNPPAAIYPSLRGVWRWRLNNVLRFEPSGGFPIASEYKLVLEIDRIIKQGEEFVGDRTIALRTDHFMVQKVIVSEEPTAAPGRVSFRGELHFNYNVDPAALAPLIRLRDPSRPQPITVELIDSWHNRVISFRTGDVQKEKDERTLTLFVDKELSPTEGNVTLGVDYTHSIPLGSRDRLTVRSVTPTPGEKNSTVRILFSSAVESETVGASLTISPQVKYRIGAEGNLVVLTGPFTPGQTFDLVIRSGLVASDSATLKDDYRAEIEMPDLPATLDFESSGMFLSASGYRNVAIESVNVTTARLTIDRVYQNNLFFFLQRIGFGRYYRNSGEEDDDDYYGGYTGVPAEFGDQIAAKELTLPAQRNRRHTQPLDLGDLVKDDEPGLYRVALTRDDQWRSAERFILITDLGVVAKRSSDELLVWVSSFRDLTSIGGATVTLISSQNQTVASGKTDERGLFTAKGFAAKLKTKEPYMIVVQRGKDFSFLLFGNSLADDSAFDVGGDTIPTTGYSASIYSGRDIYRPGETIEGAVLIRDRLLQPPSPMPLVLRHRDPKGEVRGTWRINSTAKGVAPFTLDLPSYTQTGHHLLEALIGEEVIGTYRFQVEEFVPDRIKVEIRPETPPPGRATEVKYTVESAYLFGPPASALPVETRVRLVPSIFTPRGYESYRFADNERKFDPREVSSLQATLDANGKQSFTAAIPAGLLVPSSLEAIITARVQEQGGRGVAALVRVAVHPYPFYVGLRQIGTKSPARGERARFEYVTVDASGKEIAPQELRAELYHEDWHTVLRRTPSGGYNYESTRDSQQLATESITQKKSRGEFAFTLPEYGSYRVVLTDPASGASSQIELSASGWGFSPWAMKNPGRIDLTLDKSEYTGGDVAIVNVKAPFSGRLLVTVERDKVYSTQVVTMTENSAKVSVPLSSELRPNAYITATLVRAAKDLEPGEAGRAFGAVPVNVDRESNHIRPTIEAPDTMRSKRKLTVNVLTSPGATVTVAAVDEGILQLIGKKVADPFDWFYRKLALGVSTHDIYALLLPEVKTKGKAVAGGGDGMEGLAQFVRTEGIRRSKPVAFWSGVIDADANGKATATFDVPEFQGALRIMAVTSDAGRFGSSEKLIRVRDPITILATWPRFLSLEEKVEIPVTVRNGTPKDGSFDVTFTSAGAVSSAPTQTQKTEIPRDSETTLYFPITTAANGGDLRLTVAAAANGEKASSTETLFVQPDLPMQTDVLSGSIAETATTFAPDTLARFRPGTVTRELILSPLPLVQFTGRLSYLLHYPYGCVEQTTSSVFPLIYFGDLAKELDPKAFAHQNATGYVRAGIHRLGTMQMHHGGFAWWPHSHDVAVWPSVYATHFLVEARRAGHLVENNVYDGALGFVGQIAKGKTSWGRDELLQTTYALYVLARAGKADAGTMDYLRDHHIKDLTPESRALLGAAYAAIGNPRSLNQLISDLAEIDAVRRDTGGNLASPIRNRALLLLALLDASPTDPRIANVAERLVRDAGGDSYWSTQESSFVLLALGQYFKRQKAVATWSGSVLVDGKPVGNFKAKTTRLTISGSGPVVVTMNGRYEQGAAYYSLRTRGIPTDAAFQPSSNGIRVEREYLTRNGAPIGADGVAQGDLLVVKLTVQSLSGKLDNVVVQNLLPAGLEVENPRLSTTEALPWVPESTVPDHLDLRDDRVLFFVTLPENKTITLYTLVRAVTPGTFRVPPVQAEAMYDPAIRATGPRGTLEVRVRR